MKLFKVERKEKGFTAISNSMFRDPNLSMKARGLLCTILSLPDDWDFSVNGILTLVPDGETAVRSAIKELIEYGYCTREEIRDEQTKRFVAHKYTFHEVSILEENRSENSENLVVTKPVLENQNVDNQGQQNNELINNINNKLINNNIYIPENSEKSEKIDFQEIKNLWNEMAKTPGINLPQCRVMSDNLKSKIKIRINAMSKEGDWHHILQEVFQKISKSDFLQGKSNTSFRADLTWVFQSPDNWVKIYEGRYDNKTPGSLTSSSDDTSRMFFNEQVQVYTDGI